MIFVFLFIFENNIIHIIISIYFSMFLILHCIDDSLYTSKTSFHSHLICLSPLTSAFHVRTHPIIIINQFLFHLIASRNIKSSSAQPLQTFPLSNPTIWVRKPRHGSTRWRSGKFYLDLSSGHSTYNCSSSSPHMRWFNSVFDFDSHLFHSFVFLPFNLCFFFCRRCCTSPHQWRIKLFKTYINKLFLFLQLIFVSD